MGKTIARKRVGVTRTKLTKLNKSLSHLAGARVSINNNLAGGSSGHVDWKQTLCACSDRSRLVNVARPTARAKRLRGKLSRSR